MGDIYSMATLNIGATAAAEAKSSNLGLSVNARATGYFTPARLRFERRDFSGDYIIYSDDMFGTIYRTALMRRGWVLQERMLSPRSVYFGDIFTWECTELLATEVFPGGVPHNESLRWGFNRPLRLQAMLQTDVTQESTYRRWLDIAMSSSECRLAFESDALPAISGLAKAFQDQLNDRYVAGLYEGGIIWGLLWYRIRSENASDAVGGKTHPAQYRGKSIPELLPC
jgi:hypothetical protein